MNWVDMTEMTGWVSPKYAPNEYMYIMRMKKAVELMVEGTYTVSEVSYKVGINDPFYFSKCSKQQPG